MRDTLVLAILGPFTFLMLLKPKRLREKGGARPGFKTRKAGQIHLEQLQGRWQEAARTATEQSLD